MKTDTIRRSHRLFFYLRFSTWRKNPEQMDFRAWGNRGIKVRSCFYYHSIIKWNSTQKANKTGHKKQI